MQRFLGRMLRLLLPISVVAFVLAATPAGANRAGARHSAATLVTCDQEQNTAEFRGSTWAFGKATTLQVRFALQSRSRSAPHWTHNQPPEGFDVWSTAKPGVTHYIQDETVTALLAGNAYRAVVRFRWRNAAGDVVARAVKRTPRCRQPDDRANVKVTKIAIRPGTDASTRTYLVHLLNAGDSEAPPFATGLQVNGVSLPTQATSEPLVEGDDTVLTFSGPACDAGSNVVSTADTASQVDESDELDNALAVVCPARRRNGRARS